MDNTLKYKGYIGSVSFSDEDNCFYGKIEGISDLVNYEAESVSELRNAFQESVDCYLDFCKRHNQEPEKSFSDSISIDVDPETQWKLKQLASRTGMSIAALIKQTLSKAVSILP